MGLIIAGISSGSGKTTFTIGLMRAFKNRGLKVGAFKAGPDYIDPMFHRLAINQPSYNLPAWMLSDASLRFLYDKRSKDNTISVVEGVMGYYDGHSFESVLGSTAHLASTLNLGVILIMDASSMALTAAAIVKGLMDFQSPTKIRGIVFNRIKSQGHYELLKNSVEMHTDIKCYGYLKPCDSINLESRHLGLVQANEMVDIEYKIEKMAELVESTVEVQNIIKDFSNEVDLTHLIQYDKEERVSMDVKNRSTLDNIRRKIAHEGGLVIGVAMDKAFSFYYDENLATLMDVGATLLPFSPINDEALPEGIHALYLGGGYPEVFHDELSKNNQMREDIKLKSQSGMPIYAECGGLMYLMSQIESIDGQSTEMVGVFTGVAKMTEALQHFGHVEAKLNLGILFGKSYGREVYYRGHEFHHSVIIMEETSYCIEVAKNQRTWQCGYLKDNTLATYVHNHFYSNLEFLEVLIHFFYQNK